MGTQFVHGDETQTPAGARQNLLALIAARKINPASIPKEFAPFFFDPMNYCPNNLISTAVISLAKQLQEHPVPLKEVLQLRYDNRKLIEKRKIILSPSQKSAYRPQSPYLTSLNSLLNYGVPTLVACLLIWRLTQK